MALRAQSQDFLSMIDLLNALPKAKFTVGNPAHPWARVRWNRTWNFSNEPKKQREHKSSGLPAVPARPHQVPLSCPCTMDCL